MRLVKEKTAQQDLLDYKFYCFNGEPKYCQVISDRSKDEKIDFYDMDWNRMVGLIGLSDNIHNSSYNIQRPSSFATMMKKAKALSQGIPFLRVDFYEINHHPYFGEITFFPASGFGTFRPYEWNERMGNLIVIK